MSKILLLDCYPKSGSRISKDTNGGYGTINNLGNGFVPKLLTYVAKKSIFWPPLALLNLASELISFKHNVFYSNDIDDIDSSVDFIFFSISIVCFEHELEILNKIKTKYPKMKIICVGSFVPHVQETLLRTGASLIIGEPEFLIEKYKLTSVNLNLIYAQRVTNSPFGNPDNLSLPYWVDINLPFSRHFIHGTYGLAAPILATRGCPYSCKEYCTYPIQQGEVPRSRSSSLLMDDIKYINKKKNIKNFIFRDPVFSINKRYFRDILNDLALNFDDSYHFTIETHLNNLSSDELLNQLKASFIKNIKFGIESASDDVLNNVNRFTIKHDIQYKIIEKLRNLKIKTTAFYILCQPEDNLDSIDKTISYSIQLKTDLAQYSIFTPYPGTPYYEKNKDLILHDTYSKFTQFDLVYKHKNFSPRDAKDLLGKAYSRYYLNKLFKI